MQALSTSPADQTAIRIMRANAAGLPLLIPGAFEPRHPRSSGDTDTTGDRTALAAVVARIDTLSDRERLECKRDGGGAPNQRTAARSRNSRIARLWRWLLWPHPPRLLGA